MSRRLLAPTAIGCAVALAHGPVSQRPRRWAGHSHPVARCDANPRVQRLRTQLKSLKVSPSILSADFAKLGEEVESVIAAGADWVHVDVMDGRFVSNITIGPLVVAALRRRVPEAVLDCHLMIVEPEQRINDFAKAGADIISVHCEASATKHLHGTIGMIKNAGCAAGVVLNPGTPLSAIECVLADVDLVLIMSVNPGFGGQTFIESTVDKVKELRAMCDAKGLDPWIEVDGGLGPKNTWKVKEVGASAIVAGSAVFCAPDYKAAIQGIRTSQR